MSENESNDGTTTEGDEQARLGLVLEYFSQKMVDRVVEGGESGSAAAISRLVGSVGGRLRAEDLPNTRLVITGDLVSSVNDREDRITNQFTMERGSGAVAAKTMPLNAEGVVDILVPTYWVIPPEGESVLADTEQYIVHVAAHEAVHASLFHIGGNPFDVHLRQSYDDALTQFAVMAGHQVEEHLAEYLANQVVQMPSGTTNEQLSDAFEAWERTLAVELPAISPTDPDYFQKGLLVTLNALHVLWKVLSYFAAELRTESGFASVPAEIAALPQWKQEVEPWWDEYAALLLKIPMTVEVDIVATDRVVHEISHLLQRWALGIGIDHHDTPDGAWFQMTRQ